MGDRDNVRKMLVVNSPQLLAVFCILCMASLHLMQTYYIHFRRTGPRLSIELTWTPQRVNAGVQSKSLLDRLYRNKVAESKIDPVVKHLLNSRNVTGGLSGRRNSSIPTSGSYLVRTSRNERVSKIMKASTLSLERVTGLMTITGRSAPLTATFSQPYVIRNEELCKKTGSMTKYLFLISSATGHYDKRNAIRETWAKKSILDNQNMTLVFLLGKPGTEVEQDKIANESGHHGDIVQGNFRDTYRNLTLKTVLGLRWTMECSSRRTVVIKLDDDMFVNVPVLKRDFNINQFSNSSKEIFCQVRPKGTSVIGRKKSAIWRVDQNDFVNMTMYPFTYCNGFAAVYSSNLAEQLYAHVADTPFFWIEDVYVYGMLMQKVGDVTFNRANVTAWDVASNRCFLTSSKCDVLVGKADVKHMYMFGNQTYHTSGTR